MEKLVEDLIKRIEAQKQNDKNLIKEIQPNKENIQLFILTGKIIAFDLCINELYRMLDYYEISRKGLI